MTDLEPNDSDLLRRYAETRSDEAFAALVNRHLPLVYSASLRLVSGNAHQAQDITQAVFTEVARRAGALSRHPTLAGWLHTTTHHLACRVIRAESRRADRELKAHAMNALPGEPTPDWSRIRPVLDDALQDLRESDRTVVLLRFLECRNIRSVGRTLGVSDDAARMRIDRALERLRKALGKRGITTTAAALSLSLGTHGVELLPSGLAAHIAAIAAANVAPLGATVVASGWITQFPAPLLAMKASLVPTIIAAALVAIPLALQQSRLQASQAELERLRRLASGLDAARADSDRRQQQHDLDREILDLRKDTADLPRLRSELARLRASPSLPLQAELAETEGAATSAEAARAKAQAQTEFRETQLVRINSLKHLGVAARIHASEHGDKIANSIVDLAPIAATFAAREASRAAAPAPAAADSEFESLFEFYPQPRPISFQEPGLFLFREKQPRQDPDGVWWRVYGMVDGSVQNTRSDSPDFTKVETDFGGIAQPLPESKP